MGTNILADFDGDLPLDGQPGTDVSSLLLDAHYATDAWPTTLAEVTQQYRINISFEVNDLSISDDIRTLLGFDLQGYELLRNPADHGGLIEQTSGETSEAINLLGFVAVHGLIDFFS